MPVDRNETVEFRYRQIVSQHILTHGETGIRNHMMAKAKHKINEVAKSRGFEVGPVVIEKTFVNFVESDDYWQEWEDFEMKAKDVHTWCYLYKAVGKRPERSPTYFSEKK